MKPHTYYRNLDLWVGNYNRSRSRTATNNNGYHREKIHIWTPTEYRVDTGTRRSHLRRLHVVLSFVVVILDIITSPQHTASIRGCS